MKRVFILFLVIIMAIPFVAQAENYQETFASAIGGEVSFAEMGDTLIIIMDYDYSMQIEDDAFLTPFKDMLSKYNILIMLFNKNGKIYLGAEAFLKDGEIIEGETVGLMSQQFLAENISFGN